MTEKLMLIDGRYEEETRIATVEDNILDDLNQSNSNYKQVKGNIYLGTITRIEPSLQAAFVEYGGNRHGFLSFNEIHPDYFLVNEDMRKRLNKMIAGELLLTEKDKQGNFKYKRSPNAIYSIEEVLSVNQPILIQVIKEERGKKGAALTSYITIAGRYCIFMPNTRSAGGVSRKISNVDERKKIKNILKDFNFPQGVSAIIRTASQNNTKSDIQKDMNYLIKMWDNIKNDAKKAPTPSLIYEEANIIRRVIRDNFSKDIKEIIIQGNSAYKQALHTMKIMGVHYSKKIKKYSQDNYPIFQKYDIEHQIGQLFETDINLPSGGSIVINPTEALVSIDVNSAKATKEKSLEETALKTNLEAATEIAKQARLKNLAGLIAIDFIDMNSYSNQKSLEHKLKQEFKKDKAKVQIGKISQFGIIEISRQRLHPTIFETNGELCPHCLGVGYIKSKETTCIQIIRNIEKEALEPRVKEINVQVNIENMTYLLNNKRKLLSDIEKDLNIKINFSTQLHLKNHNYSLEKVYRSSVTPNNYSNSKKSYTKNNNPEPYFPNDKKNNSPETEITYLPKTTESKINNLLPNNPPPNSPITATPQNNNNKITNNETNDNINVDENLEKSQEVKTRSSFRPRKIKNDNDTSDLIKKYTENVDVATSTKNKIIARKISNIQKEDALATPKVNIKTSEKNSSTPRTSNKNKPKPKTSPPSPAKYINESNIKLLNEYNLLSKSLVKTPNLPSISMTETPSERKTSPTKTKPKNTKTMKKSSEPKKEKKNNKKTPKNVKSSPQKSSNIMPKNEKKFQILSGSFTPSNRSFFSPPSLLDNKNNNGKT